MLRSDMFCWSSFFTMRGTTTLVLRSILFILPGEERWISSRVLFSEDMIMQGTIQWVLVKSWLKFGDDSKEPVK